MARIPYPNEADGNFKGPVLLIHGISGNAYNWLLSSDPSSDALAKRLISAGYEPWFLNNRGVSASRGHTTADLYTNNPQAYFDFDTTAFAYKDVPAALEQIRSERDGEGRACLKTTIIGHSNGGRQALLAAASDDADISGSINKVIGLAPAII